MMLVQSLIEAMRESHKQVPLTREPEFDDGKYKLLLTIRDARNGTVIEAKTNYGNVIKEEDILYIIPVENSFDIEVGKIVQEIYNEHKVRQNSQTHSQE